ncbi:MAG: hypothetical protein L3J52_06885 [Proteobacteria bacterium]|nr:hypothetical protein [Pseudomonadota bacterium]
MKRKLYFIFTALFLVFTAQAELKLQDVLDDYIEAKGGMDVIKNINSIKLNGKMTMGPMEMPMTILMKRPNKVYTSFEVQGMKGIQAFDGKVGWSVMPFMGKPDAEEMADDQLKMTKDQADIDGPLIGYKKKGYTLELIGKTEIEGTPVIEIKVTKKDGDVTHVYLDEEYKLEVMIKTKTSMMGQEVEIETYMSDYKEVGDTVIPHSMAVKIAGTGTQNLSFETVELNTGIDDSIFTMPVAPAVAEKTGEE